ncbi:TraR/DksA family transcriptional regulator [[Kitasatospora] papulosa]|uniref:TraR/DksA family transcriptional regulator n=1 Tax=[Kitasatospora] papulosa TaxID=1464011 RepID=UPI0036A66FAF
MVAKKTAVSRTASERSTAAAAEEETANAGGRTGEGTGGEEPARKAAKRTAARKKAASHPQEPEPAGPDAVHGRPAKKSAAKKSTAKKSAAKKASKKATGAAQAAEQTGVHTVVAKKSAARSTAAGEGTATAVPPAGGGVATAPADLAVRPGEDPWTPEEVEEARTELTGEVLRLRSELEASGEALAGLMRDSGDGAGDDDADTGTKNITREHELSLAAHAQETLDQTERALARLDAGTYGLCEICGKPIGKARMQAFPRATLCVEDKQKQERRG